MPIEPIIGVGGGTPRRSNATVPWSSREAVPQVAEGGFSVVGEVAQMEVEGSAEQWARVRYSKSGHPLAMTDNQSPLRALGPAGAER